MSESHSEVPIDGKWWIQVAVWVCQISRNGRGPEPLTQIRIDSMPAILPSFHCVQAQKIAVLKDIRIRCGTSSCTNGSIWVIPDVDNEG